MELQSVPEYIVLKSFADLFMDAHASYYAENRGKKLPVLDPKQIRIEVFKYFYQSDQQYNLFEKGDASEFLQSFLELVHFGLSKNPAKSNIDDTCQINDGSWC